MFWELKMPVVIDVANRIVGEFKEALVTGN
jgi:hypothetical protein